MELIHTYFKIVKKNYNYYEFPCLFSVIKKKKNMELIHTYFKIVNKITIITNFLAFFSVVIFKKP